MDIQKCYEVFELDINASAEDVKKTYQNLLKKWNPYQYGENKELQAKAILKMKEINIAYQNIQHFLLINKKAALDTEHKTSIELKKKAKAKATIYYQKIYEEILRSGVDESEAKAIAKTKAKAFFYNLYNKQDNNKTVNNPDNQEDISEPVTREKYTSKKETDIFLNSNQFISADDFRVPNEQVMLYVSISILSFTLIILLKINLILILLIVGISIGWVKVRQGQLIGQCVRISENQLPDIYRASQIVSRKLYMKLPDVFVKQDPMINAYAIGFIGKKSVVLHSATVESMTNDELISILGHEFSHIKCGHTIWTVITSSAGSFNIPLLSQIFSFIFFFWSRKAEYTCDRGGLIACSDLRASVSALAKIAVGEKLFSKLDIANLFDQKMDIDQDDVSKVSETLSTHPYIVNRIHALKKFIESPEYKQLSSLTNRQMDENLADKLAGKQSDLKILSKKERHWFLAMCLILIIVGHFADLTIFFKTVSFSLAKVVKILLTNNNQLIQLVFIIDIFNIVCAIALLKWKKIGFWGLCSSSAVIIAIGIWNGYDGSFLMRPFFGIIMLYASLNVGDKNKGWPQLE